MWAWFSTFLEKPLVRRVNRRMCIRIERFERSTCDVLMCFGSGLPVTACFSQPRQTAGLVRRVKQQIAVTGMPHLRWLEGEIDIVRGRENSSALVRPET